MKNAFRSIVLFGMFIFTNIAMSQAVPDDAGGTVDQTDTAAPIDSSLLLLAIIGISFCYYQFRKKLKTE